MVNLTQYPRGHMGGGEPGRQGRNKHRGDRRETVGIRTPKQREHRAAQFGCRKNAVGKTIGYPKKEDSAIVKDAEGHRNMASSEKWTKIEKGDKRKGAKIKKGKTKKDAMFRKQA